MDRARLGLTAALTGALGVLVLAAGFLDALRVPKIEAPSRVDLGRFRPGQTVERVIRIRNGGFRTLHIPEVRNTCGCAGLTRFPEEVPPLSHAYGLVRLRMPTAHGPFNTNLMLVTDDPKTPVARIEVHGTAFGSTVAVPPVLEMGLVQPGVKRNRAVTLRTEGAFEMVNASTSSPYLQVSLGGHASEAERSLTVAISPDAPRGPLREYIFARVRGTDPPYLVIPVKATVERGLRLTPPKLIVRLPREGDPIARSVRLTVLTEEWASFDIIPNKHSCLETSLQRTGPGTYSMQVIIEPARAPSILKTEVALRNACDDIIRIPVFGLAIDALKRWKLTEPSKPVQTTMSTSGAPQ